MWSAWSGRLVGPPEPDEVGRDTPEAGLDEHRDHVAVQVAPRRLAVEQQHHRAVGRPLVEVVDAQRAALAVGDVGVVRLEREVGQPGEPVVGRSQDLHVPANLATRLVTLRTRTTSQMGEGSRS